MMLAAWITASLELVPALAGKVFPTLGPVDAVAPYAVYGVITARGLAGDDGGTDELDEGTFQVSVYAASYGDAWSLAAAVKDALDGAAPDGRLGFSAMSASDLGREVETGLYHVAVRVDYSYSTVEA